MVSIGHNSLETQLMQNNTVNTADSMAKAARAGCCYFLTRWLQSFDSINYGYKEF